MLLCMLSDALSNYCLTCHRTKTTIAVNLMMAVHKKKHMLRQKKIACCFFHSFICFLQLYITISQEHVALRPASQEVSRSGVLHITSSSHDNNIY